MELQLLGLRRRDMSSGPASQSPLCGAGLSSPELASLKLEVGNLVYRA